MPEKELNWKFADDYVVEPEAIAQARQHSIEVGVEPVSPAVGAQLAVLAAASNATSIVEIGTGLGVSALWLLRGAPEATLTSIDAEAEHQVAARHALAAAGVPSGRIRLIAGRALEVLPRMNEASYDLVLVDADAASVIEYVEHALRLVRVGGTVAVAHALWHDRVANPARREEREVAFRTLLKEIGRSEAVVSTLSPAGDGLLQLVKLGD
ncbi:class I SAM-dependent methyltransferase [Galbitalea sp. SE-J8]|uniref:O-methyltransferase n=1 Tax=Galbitalea sp. SE-J8 TaxID=3054952 RepID=UPI00259CC755|nr:class I SAM-dependent methyltransferase [Galbitalea sp. SE-J8]MDM4764226.1 class I SAM-dependent methyltransferase [Galbitalea sp. SE-J8]